MTPPVVSGFRWDGSPAGLLLRCAALEPLCTHAFTTRQLAFRGDSEEEDYERLSAVLGVDDDHVVRVVQVHGRVVALARSRERSGAPVLADAIVTDDPALAVSVRVADCVPVLLADVHRRVVAAIHAGWRGTAAGIVIAAVETIASLDVPPCDLVAAIGPSIGPCCYQVDARVRDGFAAGARRPDEWFTPDGPDRWKLDLWRAAADQLVGAGLRPSAIHVSALCTADHLELCHSHRGEGASAGRMTAAIRIRQS